METKQEKILLEDKVLVRAEVVEKTTSSGIKLPESMSVETSFVGVVEKTGPGKSIPPQDMSIKTGKHCEMTVRIGDTVILPRYGVEEVLLEGVKYYIISESNISLILR